MIFSLNKNIKNLLNKILIIKNRFPNISNVFEFDAFKVLPKSLKLNVMAVASIIFKEKFYFFAF